MLLLPRLDADALLHEGALQVPAGASSRTRGSSTRTAGAASSEPRVRARRHRRLRRRPLLRRLRRVRQGVARRHPDPHHGRQPRARGGDAAPAADAVVPQHLVVGLHARGLLGASRGCRARRPTARSLAEHATLGPLPARRRRRSGRRASRAAVHRERDQHAAALRRRRTRRRTSRTPSTSTSSTARADAVNPARVRHEGGGALPCSRSRRAAARRCACGSCAEDEAPREPFGPDFDAIVRRAHRARPTRSTPRASRRRRADEERARRAAGLRGAALDASSSTTTS